MLERRATPGRARAIAIAAVRELHEETGLVLGETARRWCRRRPRRAALHLPRRHAGSRGRSASTPASWPPRPRRCMATIAGSGELERLDWYTPEAAHRHHVADITGKVLVEFLDWLEMAPRARIRAPADRLPRHGQPARRAVTQRAVRAARPVQVRNDRRQDRAGLQHHQPAQHQRTAAQRQQPPPRPAARGPAPSHRPAAARPAAVAEQAGADQVDGDDRHGVAPFILH